MKKELPKIRKTKFIYNQEREYNFDVNENITFHNLKKMIASAANLEKIGIRIWHEEVEYTSKENETLDSEFPQLNPVIFNLEMNTKRIDDYDRLLKLRLNQEYCKNHEGKYPYFYCHNCMKSICSECIISGEHKDHDIKEKYDYLQNSKILIEKIFKDFDNEKLDPTGKLKLKELKKIIKTDFAQLIRMLQQLENCLNQSIDLFIEDNKNHIEQIEKNYRILKASCTEGLDLLKNRLDIESIMLDENIYLEFDKKFKELELQKQRFLNDVKNRRNYNDNITQLESIINDIYSKIFEFLKKFKYQPYRFPSEPVPNINPNDVHSNILKGVKNMPRSYYTSSYKKKFANDYQYPQDSTELEFAPKNLNFKDNNDYLKFRMIKRNTNDIQKTYGQLLCMPIINTKMVLTYDCNQSEIEKKTLDSLIFKKPFNEECAWICHDNCLYVSGGISDGTISKEMYKYNPETNIIVQLSMLPEGRYGHTMCADDNNCLYLVGGNDTSILKYDLNLNRWFKLTLSLNEKRNHPNAFVYKDILYVAFGENKNKIIPTILKGKLTGSGKMDVIAKDDKNKRIFAGCILKDNFVYLTGGKDSDNKLLNNVIKIDLNDGIIGIFSYHDLKEPVRFGQSDIPKINDSYYGYFQLDGDNDFVIITIH